MYQPLIRCWSIKTVDSVSMKVNQAFVVDFIHIKRLKSASTSIKIYSENSHVYFHFSISKKINMFYLYFSKRFHSSLPTVAISLVLIYVFQLGSRYTKIRLSMKYFSRNLEFWLNFVQNTTLSRLNFVIVLQIQH